jgi:hypothetical protein
MQGQKHQKRKQTICLNQAKQVKEARFLLDLKFAF